MVLSSRLIKIFIVLLGIFSNLAVIASVSKIKPTMLFEGEVITVLATKYNSVANPLSISLLDGDGNVVQAGIETTFTGPKGFKFIAPSVSSTKSLVLKVSGGNVSADNGDTFPVVIFNAPDLDSPDPNPPDDDINVENVEAESVSTDSIVLKGKTFTADTNGALLWNSNKVISAAGVITPKSLIINGIALTVNNGGDLIWNSHTVSKAAGTIVSTSLKSSTSALGSLSLNGASAIKLVSNNGSTATVSLTGSGFLPAVLRAEYDFATEGGVVGSINMRNATLPNKARVTRAWYEVLTTLRSASDASQVGISIPTDDANGIVAPIAISDGTNPWDAGVHTTIQNGLVTNISEKTTSSKTIQLTVTGEALTAGKLVLFAEYMVLP